MSETKGREKLFRLAVLEGDIKMVAYVKGESLDEAHIKMTATNLIRKMNERHPKGKEDPIVDKDLQNFVPNCPHYEDYRNFLVNVSLFLERPDIAVLINWHSPDVRIVKKIYDYCRDHYHYSTLLSLLGLSFFPPDYDGREIPVLEAWFRKLDQRLATRGAEFMATREGNAIMVWAKQTDSDLAGAVIRAFADFYLLDGLKRLSEPGSWLERFGKCYLWPEKAAALVDRFLKIDQESTVYAAYVIYKSHHTYDEVVSYQNDLAKALVENLFYAEAQEISGRKDPIVLLDNCPLVAEKYVKSLILKNIKEAVGFLGYVAKERRVIFIDKMVAASLDSGYDQSFLFEDTFRLIFPFKLRLTKIKEYYALVGQHYLAKGDYSRALNFSTMGRDFDLVLKAFKGHMAAQNYHEALRVLKEYFPQKAQPDLQDEFLEMREYYLGKRWIFPLLDLAVYSGKEVTLAEARRCLSTPLVVQMVSSILDHITRAKSWPAFAAGRKLKKRSFPRLDYGERLLRVLDRETVEYFAGQAFDLYQSDTGNEYHIRAVHLAVKVLDDLSKAETASSKKK